MKEKPAKGARAADQAAARQERLAAALRENLKKRKDQARARPASGKDGKTGPA